jgi:hypothetical protein
MGCFSHEVWGVSHFLSFSVSVLLPWDLLKPLGIFSDEPTVFAIYRSKLANIPGELLSKRAVIAVFRDLCVIDKSLATYPAKQDRFLLLRWITAVSVAYLHVSSSFLCVGQ